MNPVESLLAGISPEHVAGLVAALLAIVWLTASRWLASAPAPVERWAAALLVITAAVHLALPLGHRHGGPLLAVGFVVCGAGFGWLAGRARNGRRWRLPSALLAVATLVAYLASVGGGEEPDQVGLATALVELAILGLAMVPAPGTGRRPVARLAGAAATVTATFLVGAIAWAAAFAGHAETTPEPDASSTSAAVSTDGAEHHHDHASRAQAGVLMRPGAAAHHATAGQRQAAADLAAATSAAVARYADIDAALADGFELGLQKNGTDVHIENPAHKSDGRILDPQRPEMLVYAIQGGRASLLGVVYVMEQAGRPGPAPGGPITRWHAHNLCATALPPGLGIVTPFGNCPPFSVAIGTYEMMHVWVVDNPNGPFADGLDATTALAHVDRAGLPYQR